MKDSLFKYLFIYYFIMNQSEYKCCIKNKKYGNYCYKHRKLFLFDTNNKLIINNYTGLSKDYTKIDMVNYIYDNDYGYNKLLIKKTNLQKMAKSELFIRFHKLIEENKSYITHIDKIIKIQSIIRKYLITTINKLRGEGYINRSICKNEEDFLFMTTTKEIDRNYFFSYKDSNNNIWFFDIRSFIKLIHSDKKNPYTREIIQDNIISNAKKLVNKLQKLNINLIIEEYNPVNIITQIKQRSVDIFSVLTTYGFDCNVNWFLNLSINRLKYLYKSMEDIWNYRLQLSNEVKINICPPNGIFCPISIPSIYLINDKIELQDIILKEIERFNNSIDDNHKRLGYMYFLIAISEVVPACIISNTWLQYI